MRNGDAIVKINWLFTGGNSENHFTNPTKKEATTQMKDTSKSILTLVLVLFVAFPLWVFWASYVTTVLWGWFAVPFGVQQIGIFHAAGLTLLAGVMTRGYSRSKDIPKKRTPSEEFSHTAGYVLALIFGPAFVLLFGWLIHLGM